MKHSKLADLFVRLHNSQCILPSKPKKQPRTNNSWPFEKCLNDALQYRSKKEWRLFSPKCYLAAREKKWLELCCAKMKKPRKWTLEACQASARKFSSKSEWRKKAPGAYLAAHRNKWLKFCCKHMSILRKPDGFWTFEKCQQDALQYQFKSEWLKKSKHAYDAAYRNKWSDLCCAHMKPKPRARKEAKL